MTYHLHIKLPTLNFNFFLDVTDLNELKTTLRTLNQLPNIPVRIDERLIDYSGSVQELLDEYRYHYIKGLNPLLPQGKLLDYFKQLQQPVSDDDILTITLLENEDDDPDLPTRELAPFVEVLWYQSRLSASEAHPLLTLPDITALCAMAEVLEMKRDSVNLIGALYGAYHSVLHRQVQVTHFDSHDIQLTIKVEPFDSITRALVAQGITVNP